jgi:hypothetical protein
MLGQRGTAPNKSPVPKCKSRAGIALQFAVVGAILGRANGVEDTPMNVLPPKLQLALEACKAVVTPVAVKPALKAWMELT